MSDRDLMKRKRYLRNFALLSSSAVLAGLSGGAGSSKSTDPGPAFDIEECKSMQPAQLSVKADTPSQITPIEVQDKFYVYVPPPEPEAAEQPAPAPTPSGRPTVYGPRPITPGYGVYGPPPVIA